MTKHSAVYQMLPYLEPVQPWNFKQALHENLLTKNVWLLTEELKPPKSHLLSHACHHPTFLIKMMHTRSSHGPPQDIPRKQWESESCLEFSCWLPRNDRNISGNYAFSHNFLRIDALVKWPLGREFVMVRWHGFFSIPSVNTTKIISGAHFVGFYQCLCN